MRIYLITILLFSGQLSFSQAKQPIFNKQFVLKGDNDAFLKKDGYYTNGIYFQWNKVLPNRAHKTIAQYELGQLIFTPVSLTYYKVHKVPDRPYCGYLYAKYGRSTFLTDKSMLQWDVQLGTIGTNSFAEQTINGWHKIIRRIKFIGWENQLNNELSVNTHLAYTHTVWQPSSYIKVMPIAEGNLGNAFINAKLGTFVCLGLFESNQHSELLHAAIGTSATERKRPYELFAYWFPQYIFQGYNATVQGGMFANDANAKPLSHIMYQQTWGLLYAKKRLSIKLEVVYQTQECTTQISPQRYGSFSIGRKF